METETETEAETEAEPPSNASSALTLFILVHSYAQRVPMLKPLSAHTKYQYRTRTVCKNRSTSRYRTVHRVPSIH